MARKTKGHSVSFFARLRGLMIGALRGAFLLCWRLLLRILPGRERLERWAASPSVRRSAAAALILLSLVVSSLVMRGTLKGQERFQLDPVRVSIAQTSISWLSAPSRHEIERAVKNDIEARLAAIEASNAFDPDVLERTATAIAASPWVAAPVNVRRRFPDEESASNLEVFIDLRKPVIQVLRENRVYLVDRDGIPLPSIIELIEGDAFAPWSQLARNEKDRQLLADLSLLVRRVIGVSGPAPQPGKRWENEQVLAAISVERELRGGKIDAFMPIQALDVSDVARDKNRRGEVPYRPSGGVKLLVEFSPSPLVWGKAPLHANRVEPTPGEKIEKLKALAARDPALTGASIYYLNYRD